VEEEVRKANLTEGYPSLFGDGRKVKRKPLAKPTEPALAAQIGLGSSERGKDGATTVEAYGGAKSALWPRNGPGLCPVGMPPVMPPPTILFFHRNMDFKKPQKKPGGARSAARATPTHGGVGSSEPMMNPDGGACSSERANPSQGGARSSERANPNRGNEASLSGRSLPLRGEGEPREERSLEEGNLPQVTWIVIG
jgi:hypothetical protein